MTDNKISRKRVVPVTRDNNGIEIKIDDICFGYAMDETFYLMKDGEVIGKGGMSRCDSCEKIFLEWIELEPAHQGQHLLRPALLAICDYYHATSLVFEADDVNTVKYKHLGAVEIAYYEFRQMHGLRLTVDSLKEEYKPHLRKIGCGR